MRGGQADHLRLVLRVNARGPVVQHIGKVIGGAQAEDAAELRRPTGGAWIHRVAIDNFHVPQASAEQCPRQLETGQDLVEFLFPVVLLVNAAQPAVNVHRQAAFIAQRFGAAVEPFAVPSGIARNRRGVHSGRSGCAPGHRWRPPYRRGAGDRFSCRAGWGSLRT